MQNHGFVYEKENIYINLGGLVMSFKFENVETNVVLIEGTVSPDTFEAAVQKSYVKNVGKYTVQGFRKGKAPRKQIEAIYGKGVFYDDALNEVIPDSYVAACEELNLEPVSRPEYDIKSMEDGSDIVWTAKVTIKPEVELGKYLKLGVRKGKIDIKDEDIDAEIAKVAEKNARLVTVEDRAVENGDIIKLDFDGSVDGVQFEGGQAENFDLTIGSGQFIPGFEEQLIGAEIGADIDVNVTFPEEYHATELAGKDAVFKCKVNEIKVKELPEIDDEFAQDVSEFDTLAEYKEDVKKKLTTAREKEVMQKFENDVIEKIVANATIELPQVMIDTRIDNILYDMNMRLQYQGLDLQKYLEYTGMQLEDFRAQYAERAEKDVRAQLCLEKIAEVENIEVTEEEVDAEIQKMADQYQQPVEVIKPAINESEMKYIKADIKIKKAVDLVTGK